MRVHIPPVLLATLVAMFAFGCSVDQAVEPIDGVTDMFPEPVTPDSVRGDTTFYTHVVRINGTDLYWVFATFDGYWHKYHPHWGFDWLGVEPELSLRLAPAADARSLAMGLIDARDDSIIIISSGIRIAPAEERTSAMESQADTSFTLLDWLRYYLPHTDAFSGVYPGTNMVPHQ